MSGVATLSKHRSTQIQYKRKPRQAIPQTVDPAPPFWMESVLEGFTEGVLIVSESGKLICTNQKAGYWCQQLFPNFSTGSAVPEAVWKLCQSILEGRELFPNQHLIVESYLDTPLATTLRLQGRLFQFASCPQPCLLVMIEKVTRVSNKPLTVY